MATTVFTDERINNVSAALYEISEFLYDAKKELKGSTDTKKQLMELMVDYLIKERKSFGETFNGLYNKSTELK